LIALLFNNLINELFLTRPEKRHSDCFFLGLEDIFFDDLFINIAPQFLLNEDLKLPKMTKFYLLFYYFLLKQLHLLLPGTQLLLHRLRKLPISVKTLSFTHFRLFSLLIFLVFFDNILKLEVTVLVLHQVLANIDQQSGLLGLLNTIHILTHKPKMNVTYIIPLHLVLDQLTHLDPLTIHPKLEFYYTLST
jgi:hypothetical protein